MTQAVHPTPQAALPPKPTFAIVITCADGLELPLQTELASFGIEAVIDRTGRLNANLTLEKIIKSACGHGLPRVC